MGESQEFPPLSFFLVSLALPLRVPHFPTANALDFVMAPPVLMTSYQFQTNCGTDIELELYHHPGMERFAWDVLNILVDRFGDVSHTIFEPSNVPRPPRGFHVWNNDNPGRNYHQFLSAFNSDWGTVGHTGKKAFNVSIQSTTT